MSGLISVIVPAYNAEKWLSACCESVFHQSYGNWELIIVDDGSTDGTLDTAQKLGQGRENVRVIHTENGGVCHARNTGLNAAKGAYVAFLDADDELMPQALEQLHRLIEENGADISIGWKTNMTADGQEIGCPYEKASALWSGTQALEQSLLDHPATYSVWGKLYRRWVVEDVRFIEGRKVHEDSFFLFQCLLKQPKVVLTEETVLRYRLSENSASRGGFSEKMFDILYFAEEKCRLVTEKFPQFQGLSQNVLVKAHMALLQNLCNTTDRKYRQAERDSLRAVRAYRRSFVPATPANKRWFFILTCGLYYPYKFVKSIKGDRA